MALIRSAQKADLLFQVDGGPVDRLRVAALDGVEAMSMPFRFQLELASTDGAMDFDSVVGKPGLVTIAGVDGKRVVNGVVSRFEQVNRGKRYSTYEADLVPQIWLLSFRSKSRIYQKLSIPDIIKKVLDEDGVASDRYRFSLKGTYPAWEYCVQYRESDLNFISRLMEQEGIYYFFEHKKDGHVLVMADNPEATVALEGGGKLIFRPSGGGLADKEHIYDFRFSHEVRSGMATLREYNHEKPSTDLEAKEQADRDADLEIYDYPGDYEEPSEGKQLAKARMEELRATRARGTGESSSRRFLPGFRVTLQEHPRSDFNKEYLLLRVHHSGTQPQVREEDSGGAGAEAEPVYQNSFECIPSDVPYRPDRLTPRPTVHGSQTAIVVGPSGEKVYMDDQGRARVMFYWDREGKNDENCTCWIRVSQGYAGPTHGIQFPPLVGDEVIVDFLEGDPDRPLITGRVYNANNPPPLKPDDRIQNVLLTPYQHRLLLDDKKAGITLNTGGSETLYMGDAKEDTDFGNNIKLSTKDGHWLQLAKGDKHKGVMLQTEAKHLIELRDDPKPGIFLVDKNGSIYLHLDTENKTINLINDTSTEINIKCDGGTIKVAAAEIDLDASNKVKVTGGTEISLSAPQIKIEGQTSIEASAPQVKIEGQAQLEATGGMTTVEGKGMATLKAGGIMTIKGGMVMIN